MVPRNDALGRGLAGGVVPATELPALDDCAMGGDALRVDDIAGGQPLREIAHALAAPWHRPAPLHHAVRKQDVSRRTRQRRRAAAVSPRPPRRGWD